MGIPWPRQRTRANQLVILDRLTEISGDNKQLRGQGKSLTSLSYFRVQNVYHHFLDQAVSTNERDHEFYSVPLVWGQEAKYRMPNTVQQC